MTKTIKTVSSTALALLLGMVMLVPPTFAAPSEVNVFDNVHASVAQGADYAPDEVLVRYKNDSVPFRVQKVSPGQSVEQAVVALSRNPNVEYAVPNHIMTAFTAVNDEYYADYQWNFGTFADTGGVGAEAAWGITTGSNDVIVAVIDTGISSQAPDFAGTCILDGIDYSNNDNDAIDDQGHGTHVAGTIAQATNNEIGVAGLAYNTCLMPVKVLDADGSGSVDDVALGIIYAADNFANVINLSLGGSANQVLEDAVAYAHSKGVTVIAATGNDAGAVSYPAAYDDYVIAVGATRKGGVLAPYSNFGSSVDVVAPGGYLEFARIRGRIENVVNEGILQQTFDSEGVFGYSFYSGTSMATPHVAAAAALLIANENATTTHDVRAALESTAHDLGTDGWDKYYGHGLIDIPAALTWTNAPVANAGPNQTVMAEKDGSVSVELDASASSDLGGVIMNYLWTEDSVELGTEMIFTTDFEVGTHTVTLTVTDDRGMVSVDEVVVVVEAYVNQLPSANAGPDQILVDVDGSKEEFITLDGRASSDDGGVIVGYEWSLSDGEVVGDTATTGVTVLLGNTTFFLEVTDDDGATSSESMTVTLNETPSVDMFMLTALAGKVKGEPVVVLSWTNDPANFVDIYRKTNTSTEFLFIANSNGNTYEDVFSKRTTGTYIYQVCETDSLTICSSEKVVIF